MSLEPPPRIVNKFVNIWRDWLYFFWEFVFDHTGGSSTGPAPGGTYWNTHGNVADSGDPANRLEIDATTNGGTFFIEGTTGATPTELAAAGTYLAWLPAKAAFRAGAPAAGNWADANIGAFSVAFGQNNEATVANTFAAGNANIASGFNATAIGTLCQATGNGAVALGQTCFATATAAVSMGQSCRSNGIYSFSAGFSNVVDGAYGTAAGRSNTVNREGGVAIGRSNSLAGTYEAAFGFNNVSTTTSTASYNFLCGSNNTAGKAIGGNTGLFTQYCFVGGDSSDVDGFGSFVFGKDCYAGGSFTLYLVAIGQSVSCSANNAIGIGKNVTVSGTSGVGIGTFVSATATNAISIGVGASAIAPMDCNTADTMFLGAGSADPTLILRNNRAGVLYKDPLSTLDVGGSVGYKYTPINATNEPYTIGANDNELSFIVDTSTFGTGIASGFNLFLPKILSTAVDRRMYHFVNSHGLGSAGNHDIALIPAEGDYIYQGPNTAPVLQGPLLGDGTDEFIAIGRGNSAQLLATFSAYDPAGGTSYSPMWYLI